METTRPNHIEVANHFYHDSVDFIQRYKVCDASEFPSFYSKKSKRMKQFIDLRMSIESALKGIASYKLHSDMAGEKLVKKIEGYKHHINKFLPGAEKSLGEAYTKEMAAICSQLSDLPVGLRYRLDAMDFHRNKESLYYDTIGCDLWMARLLSVCETLSKYLGVELSKESRIIGSGELMDEIRAPRYEKYSPKKH